MERKIMVANTRTQTRKEITADVTTLRELKLALTANGIDYANMDFTEGISKTRLISDESILPSGIMYKGQPTNDLVILLTNTSKKVASGCEHSRKEAYAIINENEWMKEAIKEEFGINYTLINTENLWLFIDENLEDEEETEEEEEEEEIEEKKTSISDDIVNALYTMVKSYTAVGTLSYKYVEFLADDLKALADQLKEAENKTYNFGGSKISDSEIDDILASI